MVLVIGTTSYPVNIFSFIPPLHWIFYFRSQDYILSIFDVAWYITHYAAFVCSHREFLHFIYDVVRVLEQTMCGGWCSNTQAVYFMVSSMGKHKHDLHVVQTDIQLQISKLIDNLSEMHLFFHSIFFLLFTCFTCFQSFFTFSLMQRTFQMYLSYLSHLCSFIWSNFFGEHFYIASIRW